jgi:hypothetical protein
MEHLRVAFVNTEIQIGGPGVVAQGARDAVQHLGVPAGQRVAFVRLDDLQRMAAGAAAWYRGVQPSRN